MRWSLAAVQALILFTCAAVIAQPPTLAVVARAGSDSIERKVASAAAAALSDVPDVRLVERQELDRLLAEKSLTLSGLLEQESWPQVGAMIGVDLFLLVESDPAGGVVGAVGFEARTGARLVDVSISAANPDVLTPLLAAMLGKKQGLDHAIHMAVLPPRNVDLPPALDAHIMAVMRLLERGLLDLPQVVLLERQRLEHLVRERKLPLRADEAAKADEALQGSTMILQLQAERDVDRSARWTLHVMDIHGRIVQSLPVVKAVDDPSGAVIALLQTFSEMSLRQTIPKPGRVNLPLEARRFAMEAMLLRSQEKYAAAIAPLQAALALRPRTAPYQYALMMNQISAARDLMRQEPGHAKDSPWFSLDSASFDEARQLTLDALDLGEEVVRPYGPFEKRNMQNPRLLLQGDEAAMGELIRRWRRLKPADAPQSNAVQHVRERYRDFYRRQMSLLLAPVSEPELHPARSFSTPFRYTLLYCRDRAELDTEINGLYGRWLELLAQLPEPTRLSPAHRLDNTLHQLHLYLSQSQGDVAADLRDLLGLRSDQVLQMFVPTLQKMSEHRVALIRFFGQQMLLQADLQANRVGGADALARLDQLVQDLTAALPESDAPSREVIGGVLNHAFTAWSEPPGDPSLVGALHKHAQLVPRFDQALRQSLPYLPAGLLSSWLSAYGQIADDSQRRWALAEMESALPRLAHDRGDVTLAAIRREWLRRDPSLGVTTAPWQQATVLFDVNAWIKSQDPEGQGKLRGADVVAGRVMALVVWRRSADPPHRNQIDWVEVNPQNSTTTLLCRMQGDGRSIGKLIAFNDHYAVAITDADVDSLYICSVKQSGFQLQAASGDQANASLPGRSISAIGLIGHCLVVATDDPGHLIAVQLDAVEHPLRLIASSARKNRNCELDDTGRFRVTAIAPDVQRERLVMAAYVGGDRWNPSMNDTRHGLYAWSPADGAVKKLLTLDSPHMRLSLAGRQPGGVLLTTRGQAATAWFEFASNQLQLLTAEPQYDGWIAQGVSTQSAMQRAPWHGAPQVRIGDWLWRGTWDRLHLATGRVEVMKPLGSNHTRSINTLTCLPEPNRWLVGNDHCLWIMTVATDP